MHVQTEVSTTRLGNFQILIDKEIDPPIDVLACSAWGGLELSDEEYGTDERLLPSFYLVRILFDKHDEWVFPEDIANKIAGPVTITIVNINLFGAEKFFHAAKNFERAMKDRNISSGISTQFIVPGVLASVTIAERTEPHQVLVASQIFNRESIPNLEYGKVRE